VSKIYYPQARVVLNVVFDGFGPTAKDTPPKIIPTLPSEMSISRNAYNQADGWEVTFDADDLPIDPRLVRSGSAELYLFSTRGIRPDQRLISKQFGQVDEFTHGQEPMVAGLFDDHGVTYDSSGRWVTISGQDYTALLMEKQYPPTAKGRPRRIPVGKKLDVILKELLAGADTTGRLELKVENLAAGEVPTVKPQTKGQKRGIVVEQDTSYWDIMYKLAIRHGFILFVRGLSVVLTKPQNLHSSTDRKIRRMVWGRNLEALTMDRHLGKEVAPNIVIKAYDSSLREPITVDFPVGHFKKVKKSGGKANKKTGKTTTKTDEYQIIPVYGITDRETLQAMAESLYHQLGSGERTVSFSTKDLTDLSEDEQDLLNLAAGDAVTIEFDEFNINRALLANNAVTKEGKRVVPEGVKVQHLVDRGFGEAIAQVIAAKYNDLKTLDRPLRVREATYTWSVKDGVGIEAQLVDFILPGGAREADQKKARKESKKADKDGKPVGLPEAREKALKDQHG